MQHLAVHFYLYFYYVFPCLSCLRHCHAVYHLHNVKTEITAIEMEKQTDQPWTRGVLEISEKQNVFGATVMIWVHCVCVTGAFINLTAVLTERLLMQSCCSRRWSQPRLKLGTLKRLQSRARRPCSSVDLYWFNTCLCSGGDFVQLLLCNKNQVCFKSGSIIAWVAFSHVCLFCLFQISSEVLQ